MYVTTALVIVLALIDAPVIELWLPNTFVYVWHTVQSCVCRQTRTDALAHTLPCTGSTGPYKFFNLVSHTHPFDTSPLSTRIAHTLIWLLLRTYMTTYYPHMHPLTMSLNCRGCCQAKDGLEFVVYKGIQCYPEFLIVRSSRCGRVDRRQGGGGADDGGGGGGD